MEMSLLELIINGTSIDKIKEKLNISFDQIMNLIHKLEIMGYEFDRYGDISGRVYFIIKKTFKDNNIRILNTFGSNSIRFIVDSDIHFGSDKFVLENLDIMYNYAIKNNIHNIINTGDIIDGVNAKDNYLNKLLKQISDVIEYHPYEKSINNYILYGNHDYLSLDKKGINISKIITNYRDDFINIGFGSGCLKVNKELIGLEHKIYNNSINNKQKINFIGHSHVYNLNNVNTNRLDIKVPSLSHLRTGCQGINKTGFLDVTIFIENKKFSNINIKFISLDDQMEVFSECSKVLTKK